MMSTKFYLRNRQTGKRWEPEKDLFGRKRGQFVALYDSGYPFIVTRAPYETYITEVNMTEWELVVQSEIKRR